MSSIVDIEDILNHKGEGYTEADIKRICAEITKRYHDKGYTAFYIKKAILNKDGTAELFFNESIVKEISVPGLNGKSEGIASSIYKRGDVFNEFILRENISSTRKKYNLKYLNVSVKRTDDDQIVLNIKATERYDEICFGISSSPMYGRLPELAYTVNYGMFHAGAAISSSFSQKDTSIAKLSFFLKRDISQDKSGFVVSSDYYQREDSFYDNNGLIYEHDSFTSGAGIFLSYGVLRFDFLITGTYDILDKYPGMNGGTSFSGIELRFNYNDIPFKIDYDDITSCGIDFLSGWNFIENSPVCRTSAEYRINVPLLPGFFLSFNGNFFYTSDRERFLQFYIFDQYLPCRNNDLSYSSWKNIAGIDLVPEVMKRTLYIAPCFKWGLHNSGDEMNSVYAAGIKGLFFTEKIKVELSYLYDLNYAVKDGYFLIAAAGYL